jgi:hypothetical protein
MPLLIVPHGTLEGELLATVVPRDLARGGCREPISVMSRIPEVWQNNKFVRDVFVGEEPPGHRLVRLSPPQTCGPARRHALLQVMDEASRQLGQQYPLTELRPHVEFTEVEKERNDAPGFMKDHAYWCMCASLDQTRPTTWWAGVVWQQVTHVLAGDATFPLVLQVGIPGAHTPTLRDCLSLADEVSLRELMWLVYHSSGMLSGPGPMVHLAAACLRPSVSVVGGTVSPQTCTYDRAAIHAAVESIPLEYRQFIDLLPSSVVFETIGQLPCCLDGGCCRDSLVENAPNGCERVIVTTRPGTQRHVQPFCLHSIPYSRVAESAQAIQRSRA